MVTGLPPLCGLAGGGGQSGGAIWTIRFTFPAFIYILCFKKPGDLSFCSNSRVVIPLMKEGLGQLVPSVIFLGETRAGKDYTSVLFQEILFFLGCN